MGRWFKQNPGKRENLFLATKFAASRDAETGDMRIRNDPEYIHQAIDKSLTRLGLPYVDLYYCHRIDKDQPIEITVGEMKKLQDAGKVKYLGLSECSAETLRRACKVVHIDAVQLEYSPFTLDIEHNDLLSTCRELGVAMIAYSPLGRGFLTGAIRSPDDFDESDFRRFSPRFAPENFHKNLELVDKLTEIAAKKGCTAGQITLAWLLAQGNEIIPIPGTTRIKNYDENMGALKVELSEDEEKEIREFVTKAEVSGDRYASASAGTLFVTTKPLE